MLLPGEVPRYYCASWLGVDDAGTRRARRSLRPYFIPLNPMKIATVFLSASVIVLMLAGVPVHSAEPAPSATLTGRVQLSTGQYVSNATVSVKGTTFSTTTDPYGYYRFTQLPAGPVLLQVSYTGQRAFE